MFKFEKKKLENYLGEYLYSMLKRYNCFVAGGTITSLFTNREINDIDIYFRSRKDAHDFVEEVIEDRDWIISFTKKAVMFVKDEVKCQVIYFDSFNSAEEIFNTFDFTVCMGAYDFQKEEFVLHDEFLKHNSQRLLKFNHKTAFPIISALRVKKYEEKGYSISKPEFLRVILTCLNLNIDNYEDLKEQMGGMYGINYDKILDDEENKEFNLEKIIEKMIDLNLSDDYFNVPESKVPENIEEILIAISGEKVKVIKFKDKLYAFTRHSFDEINSNRLEKCDYYELVDTENILKNGMKFYKFVKKTSENKYFSFYDNKFEYVINNSVKAKESNPCWSGSWGIYCDFINNVNNLTYSDKKDGVLIELELENINDILDLESFRLKKAKVIREVPKEEYKMYMRKK